MTNSIEYLIDECLKITGMHLIFVYLVKQLLSNFESWKSWKQKQLWGLTSVAYKKSVNQNSFLRSLGIIAKTLTDRVFTWHSKWMFLSPWQKFCYEFHFGLFYINNYKNLRDAESKIFHIARNDRNSHRGAPLKICSNFAKFTEKHQCLSLFS